MRYDLQIRLAEFIFGSFFSTYLTILPTDF